MKKHVNIGSLIFKIVALIVLIFGVLMILYPFYIMIITAFKTQAESAADFFALPATWTTDNFLGVINKSNYFMYFSNSVIITVSSIVLIFLFVPMCAYAIARICAAASTSNSCSTSCCALSLFRSRLSWCRWSFTWAGWV